MNIQEKYGYVRGFDFQPPWGSNGRDIWARFDEVEYRRLIQLGKQAFPKMNTIRVWLSFDAWYDDREQCIQNMRKAAQILAEESLKMIPVYCNGWHAVPDYGGFSVGILQLLENGNFEPYPTYVREVAQAFEDLDVVLMHDLSNEPLNNFMHDPDACPRLYRFLKRLGDTVRSVSDAPVTIGSQGYPVKLCGCQSDFEFFDPIVDVHSFHPYSVCYCPKEQHKDWLESALRLAQPFDKPVIITECCWGAPTDEARGDLVKLELKNFAEAGVGFIAHALTPSPVADLHPLDGINPGMYMPFMLLDGTIRPHHECFNLF